MTVRNDKGGKPEAARLSGDRFAPRGLLARRRAVAGPSAGVGPSAARQSPPRAVGGAPQPPARPLPDGLLPLPPGFELSPEVATSPADPGARTG